MMTNGEIILAMATAVSLVVYIVTSNDVLAISAVVYLAGYIIINALKEAEK